MSYYFKAFLYNFRLNFFLWFDNLDLSNGTHAKIVNPQNNVIGLMTF